MNVIILAGNLGQEPEIRATNGGSICNMSLAVKDRVKEGGEWKDHTEWFRLVVFGRTADNCADWLHKGDKITVRGKLRTRKWTDKEGQERQSTEVLCDEVEFPRRQDGSEGGQRSRDEPRSGPAGRERQAYGKEYAEKKYGRSSVDLDDEIPF